VGGRLLEKLGILSKYQKGFEGLPVAKSSAAAELERIFLKLRLRRL